MFAPSQRIVSRCNGKIIIIDTGKFECHATFMYPYTYVLGISHAYGGALSALSIDYVLTPLTSTDVHPPMARWQETWVERELVTAIYENGRETLADDARHVQGDFAGY